MKRIKSILLNSDFSGLRKRKKNVFNLNINKNNKSLSKKSSFGFKQNTEKNISFYLKNNLFPTANKNLELINYYLSENKSQQKTDKLYRTEIRNSHTIIKFPSFVTKRNEKNVVSNNKFLTSYASSRKNPLIPKIIKAQRKKDDEFLDNCQIFVNLHLLLGKRQIKKKIETEKLYLDSMSTRKDYTDFILRNSILNFKTTQDTFFAHNINSNFILKGYEKYKLDAEIQKKKINRNLARLKNIKSLEEETKDVVNPDFIDYLKIKRKLRKLIFFENEINFKYDQKFFCFNKYENKINYIYDICHFPHFNNCLLKYNNEINNDIKYINELDCPNYINYKVWNNLNLKKAKIQTFKDKGINDTIIITENISIDNRNIKNLNIQSKSKNDNFNKGKIMLKVNEKLKNIKNSKFKIHFLEEIEDYFVNKIIYKNNSFIASEELKKVIYNKF